MQSIIEKKQPVPVEGENAIINIERKKGHGNRCASE